MPADDDWVLIASYKDESLLRNFVAYSTARWLGRYAPRTRLVEVVVNDSYEGVYLLAEKLKLQKNRVAVDDSKISGGYLLEMISPRRAAGEQFFTTPVKNQPIVYADPDRDDLSYGRATWIRDYVNRFERRLYGDRFTDRRRGYRRYLDMDAAVDFLLLNELFRNADTFRNSTYMHKGVGTKLVLGPLWDFDHALGNDGTAEDNARTGWEYGASPWAERLYADPAFRRADGHALEGTAEARPSATSCGRSIAGAAVLADAQERNFSRWPIFGTSEAGPPDPRTGEPPADYAQAVDYLKWWLAQRSKWIDNNIDGLQP